jgi:YfiH family protein
MSYHRCIVSGNPRFLTLPSLEAGGEVFHGFWTRGGREVLPSSAAPALRVDRVITGLQVHGDGIAVIREEADLASAKSRPFDALITDRRETAIGVYTADCAPLLLFDPLHRAVGAVHAGWRGTVRRIAEKTVSAMTAHFGTRPSDLLAAIGPTIGPCCYEVGREVLDQMPQALPRWDTVVFPLNGEKARLDLQEANRLQLQEAGIPPDRIGVLPLCTSCRRDLFYSFRGERGKKGQMLNAIMLTNGQGDGDAR